MIVRHKPLSPRPIHWHMKPLESAETSVNTLSDGRLELTIRHDLIKGVTPAMLGWWFRHIDGSMNYEGRTYNRYLAWHPIDHIHYRVVQRAADGTAGAGAKFWIIEAFGANPDYLVNSVADVPRNDEGGITLSVCKFGLEVMRLEHTFQAAPGGTMYFSRMKVGAKSHPVKGLINHLVVPRLFGETKGRAWLKHNVEEVGNFEFFLPALYEQCGAA